MVVSDTSPIRAIDPAIRPLIHQLRAQLQFRLSIAIEHAALREAGESPDLSHSQ